MQPFSNMHHLNLEGTPEWKDHTSSGTAGFVLGLVIALLSVVVVLGYVGMIIDPHWGGVDLFAVPQEVMASTLWLAAAVAMLKDELRAALPLGALASIVSLWAFLV